MTTGSSPHLDLPGLADWLRRHVPRLTPPIEANQLRGGLSNLTYLLKDAAGTRWVLRRPPLHGVLHSAHDVLREHRIMKALENTSLPVPAMVATHEDPGLIGAPFFVMNHVEGVVLRMNTQAGTALTRQQRHRLGIHAIDALANLHMIEPSAAGLADLGRREAYVPRQLRRWSRQWEQSRTRAQPLAEYLHQRLSDSVPPPGRTGIVHGDFRLDNMIVDHRGDIQAILDWELCTLGDPLADLGTTLAYWVEPTEEPYGHVPDPTASPGFPGREEIRRRYTEMTGAPVRDTRFYTALARWKIAIILEGVHSRHLTGAMGTATPELTGITDSVDRLFHDALSDLDGLA